LKDVFAIQDEISRGIVNNLRLKLGRGRRRYETSTEAYDLYLRARAWRGRVRDSCAVAFSAFAICNSTPRCGFIIPIAFNHESLLSYDGEAMRLIILAVVWTSIARAQQYDLVLRGGRVIDPGNTIDGRMDVAVSNIRIAAVQPDIPAVRARKTLAVTGFYVVPGLVALQAHVYTPPFTTFFSSGCGSGTATSRWISQSSAIRIAQIRTGLKAAHSRVVAEAEGYEAAPANLAEGMAADLTLRRANRTVLTIRNGRVITDDDGPTIPDVNRAGPYSNFK
jgi:hypothetical protein